MIVDRRNGWRNTVGDHRLLEQTEQEQRETDGEILLVKTGRRAVELRHHLAIVNDRTGNELRKEQHEQAIVLQRERLDAPRMNVDQKRDFLECDERYAQRQNDMSQDQVGAECIVYRGSEEIGVLEIAEKCDIERKAQHKNRQGGMASLLVPNQSLEGPR